MSILIKGINMPTSCGDCRFCGGIADTDCGPCAWCDIDGKARVSDTRQDCPLIEVPTPHGPLVDTKNLLETIKRGAYFIRLGHYKTDFGMTCFSIAQAIHEQPIIIEAEEGEEE